MFFQSVEATAQMVIQSAFLKEYNRMQDYGEWCVLYFRGFQIEDWIQKQDGWDQYLLFLIYRYQKLN